MTSSKDIQSQNKSALIYILAAVVLFSALPITFSLGGASNAPFLFVALMYLFYLINNITYLFVVYRKKINQKTFKTIMKNVRNPAIFYGSFVTFGYVFFAFALRYVDEAIGAVLIETSYIFTVILMARLFGKEGRYAELTTQKWFLFAMALIGVGFVIVSQSATLGSVIDELFTYTALGGVGLVLMAAFLAGLGLPMNQLWGSDVSRSVNEKDEVFYTIVANSIGKTISVPVLFGVGLLSGESFGSLSGLGILSAIVYGFFGLGIGDLFFRIANAKTTNLGINALFYLIPAVSLVSLELASLIDIPRVDWLIIGLVAVITANLLLNSTAEIRAAYKALIIALWVCGMLVYLHDGFTLSGYAEVVGFISTLFILILVFRADRMVRRTTDEENGVFLLYNRLSTLVRKGWISEDATRQLREIDEHTKPEQLLIAYRKLKDYFETTRERHPEYDDKLDEMEASVDSLAHSKQQGANFGELIALGVITFIMVSALLLFKPPELFGWEGLFTEITSFLLAAVIVFLFANIFDLQHDRTNAVLRKETGSNLYSVAFDDATDRGGERWVSVIVCVAIAVAYIWLFVGKWLY